jgi:hypothetical protein
MYLSLAVGVVMVVLAASAGYLSSAASLGSLILCGTCLRRIELSLHALDLYVVTLDGLTSGSAVEQGSAAGFCRYPAQQPGLSGAQDTFRISNEVVTSRR